MSNFKMITPFVIDFLDFSERYGRKEQHIYKWEFVFSVSERIINFNIIFLSIKFSIWKFIKMLTHKPFNTLESEKLGYMGSTNHLDKILNI